MNMVVFIATMHFVYLVMGHWDYGLANFGGSVAKRIYILILAVWTTALWVVLGCGVAALRKALRCGRWLCSVGGSIGGSMCMWRCG